MTDVVVELFGIPRQRAGCAEVRVQASTALEALTCVQTDCPALHGLLRPDDTLSPHYLLSVDGERFVSDLREALRPGERLLLLSADPGG